MSFLGIFLLGFVAGALAAGAFVWRMARAQLTALEKGREDSLKQMKDSFDASGAAALAQMQERFVALANQVIATHTESAKGDLAARQESIKGLLAPLQDTLRSYQDRVRQNENQQSTAIGEVKKALELLSTQSQALSGETAGLRRVLSAGSTRGRWGEITLRRVLESSGMSPHCDFLEQKAGESGKPDVRIRLPNDRCIIIDAKALDLEFLATLDLSDEAKRKEALAVHAAKLRQTIKALAARDYPSQFEGALDHVVMFVAFESLYSAALEADPELLLWAAKHSVVLATPASLIGLLSAMNLCWVQHAQTTQSKEIAEAAEELYNRVATFIGHFENIRAGLGKAADAYNAAVGSYERSVRPGGERLLKYRHADAIKALPEIDPLTDPLRNLSLSGLALRDSPGNGQGR